jgi:3-methyladenine DNA glycosylase AlkD
LNSPADLTKAVRRDLAALARRDTPSVRKIRQQYSRVLKTAEAGFVYKVVRGLLENDGWPERVIAWEILASHKPAFQLLNDKAVEEMADGLSDWESIDLFGVTVLGQAWRDGLVKDRKIDSWAKSSDRWRRRLALVATVPLNSKSRGGNGDAERTLKICTILLNDRDDMVVKAMSWALRELAKRDASAVEDFIKVESARLAPRVKREVTSKLKSGRKSSTRKRIGGKI